MNSTQHNTRTSDYMKSELRNFIHLLQTDNIKNSAAYGSLRCNEKLSIILSASQPQSSSIDKQNQSSNISIKNSQFTTLQKNDKNDKHPIYAKIKQLGFLGVTKQQQKTINEIVGWAEDMIMKNQSLEQKICVLGEQLSKEKKGTDQLLEALMRMDEEQKEIWKMYDGLSQKYSQKQAQLSKKNQQFASLRQQDDSYKKELKFVKKLIYVANGNYEQLYNKYKKLIHKNNVSSSNNLKSVLVLREKRSENNLLTERSTSNFSKCSNRHLYSPFQHGQKLRGLSPQDYEIQSSCSPIRKGSKSKSRKTISPLLKDKQKMQCNFKDVYRKMLLKNLKTSKNKKIA